MTKGKTLVITAIFIVKGAVLISKEHESALTIPYMNAGDWYIPNFALRRDAGHIGFRVRWPDELFKRLAPFNQKAP